MNLVIEMMSDEQLDQVAGGTFDQNVDLLVAMGDIDPQGTMNLFKQWNQQAPNAKEKLNLLLFELVRKNFSDLNVEFYGGAIDVQNTYIIGGKNVSHQQFLDYIKVMGKGDDF